MPFAASVPPNRSVPLALFAGALVTLAGPATVSAQPIRDIAGLSEIAVYEATATVTRVPFQPAGSELLNRREPALNDGNRDFSFYAGENYDVFYSDAQGAPNPLGAFLTIEATWTGSATDGSMNITGAELLVGGQRVLADTVASFRLGSRCSGSACSAATASRAVDGDLTFNTIPRMGATNASDPADRIRLTLGFPRPGGSSLVLNPVTPVTRGGVLSLSWNSVGTGPYALAITAGPGVAAPLALGTFACCSTTIPVPLDVPPGTYQVAVASGNVVSAPVNVVIQSNVSAPVLAPIPPVGPGGLLTVIWTPNPAVLYDLMVLSGPGISSPVRVGQAACCVITLPIGPTIPAGTYTVAIVGAGVQSNIVSLQILGSAQGFELSATSTIVRPGLQTTLSWTDRGAAASSFYNIFAGPAGAASLALVVSGQGCCVLTVPHNGVVPGSYDVYVQDSNGVRSNRVTIRFDP